MNELYWPKISRRNTLQWFVGVMVAYRASPYAFAGAGKPINLSIARGYGADPDLNHPVVPWSRTLTPHQLQLTAALADLVLPGSGDAPAPSAVGIPDFVDEWVSAPYPEQQADRTTILDGLAWLDSEATRRWQNDFLKLNLQRQLQLLDITFLASQKSAATIPDARKPLEQSGAAATVNDSFFPRFRFLVVGAYYTTTEGFKDIGYIGNVPLQSYPAITEKERTILDEELRKLGI